MTYITLHEATKQKAQNAAIADFKNSMSCDSARHNALPGSAWDKWYVDQYRNCKLNTNPTGLNHEYR